jgi:hypothetical protein
MQEVIGSTPIFSTMKAHSNVGLFPFWDIHVVKPYRGCLPKDLTLPGQQHSRQQPPIWNTITTWVIPSLSRDLTPPALNQADFTFPRIKNQTFFKLKLCTSVFRIEKKVLPELR